MLYKFKSRSTGDVIMLQPSGRRLLNIIGKTAPDPGAPDQGIILPQDMKAAVAAIQSAIAQEEREQKAVLEAARAANAPAPHFDVVSLRQRAQPFIDMLERSERDGHEIVWGV